MSNLTANTTTTHPQGTDEIVETPSWLPNGCPAWCFMDDLHREHDEHVDRIHLAEGIHVEASTEDRIEGEPATVDTHMNQHYRETEPRIWVGIDETNKGHYLTVDEAREYALRLLELTKIADGI
jgi:hypothetical protein